MSVHATSYKCDCGQVTEIELLDGKWCYKASRHGNREPWGGKCFNCSKILKAPPAPPAPPIKKAKPKRKN